ncbi:MAG: hypothetical protein IJO92_02105, partial [Clostridia bacterium]|nr:hypothetical protein [Clostridia bacterium]
WTEDERIIRVVSHINEHIAEAITLDELAAARLLQRTHFRKRKWFDAPIWVAITKRHPFGCLVVRVIHRSIELRTT